MTQGRRETWEFEFPATRLKSLVMERVHHHTTRRNHWLREVEQAKNDLKANGIEFRDEPDMLANAYGASTQVNQRLTLDQSLERTFAQAKIKVQWHTDRLTEYTRWYALLQDQPPERTFTLTYADAQFFGIE